MMKLSHAINTLVASILVVPALTLQGQGEGGLEHALSDTVYALEYLAGLEPRIQRDARASLPLIREATEAPLPDARERDERLVTLRNEVARLQMVHDDLAGRANFAGGAAHVAFVDPIQAAGAGSVTTGLTDEVRESISGAPPPRPARAPTGESIEASNFCADPARRGQALYRAGRYDECVTFLKAIENNMRAVYWMARAQEKLGRIEDALRGYRLVAQTKDDAALAERAQADAEFLEWERQFSKKSGSLPSTPVTRGAEGTP